MTDQVCRQCLRRYDTLRTYILPIDPRAQGETVAQGCAEITVKRAVQMEPIGAVSCGRWTAGHRQQQRRHGEALPGICTLEYQAKQIPTQYWSGISIGRWKWFVGLSARRGDPRTRAIPFQTKQSGDQVCLP